MLEVTFDSVAYGILQIATIRFCIENSRLNLSETSSGLIYKRVQPGSTLFVQKNLH